MKRSNFKQLLLLLGLLITAYFFSCSGRSGKVSVAAEGKRSQQEANIAEKLIVMRSPGQNSGFRLGDEIRVVIDQVDADLKPDSVMISFDGRHMTTLGSSSQWEYLIAGTETTTAGRKSVKATAFREGRAASVITVFVIFYSDTPPERWGYRVVNTYPHDSKAFTQGLFYSDGFLYEGTGQQTGSTLREVDLRTGKVLRLLNLQSDLFGEGITLYKGRIFQVTWQSKVGFVYEKETFRQLNRIYYQSEGWGLTTIGDRIVMSEGTNLLYFMEPESFTIASRLEVYDNEKKVDNLNELEFINGEIWANIWMTDLIARIDPSSGKVLGYIDLKGLLGRGDMGADTDVLNGIAWDSEGGRIFVTGKNWPKLFEISITR
ncbi:MAG: glutaminyl-peptide cyclotransferase [Bacteroidales bacterium]|jgi:glutamine cyclotransferase|nr:glutaminyl-peptide cyclotransferase [Bacteroidales bacterium]